MVPQKTTALRRRLRRILTAVAVATGLAALNVPSPAVAAGPYPDGARGYDISWPQCGGPFPPGGQAIAVVGIDDGHPFNSYDARYSFNPNPCLDAEWAWARTSPRQPSVYLNTDYPHGANASEDPYVYGWNSAARAVDYATAHGVRPAIWWLDVETVNWWPCDANNNCDTYHDARVVQGNIDLLRSRQQSVGVYSTRYQWNVLVGGYAPGVPNWLAEYNDQQPWNWCGSNHSFGGGDVWQVQTAPGQFDPDYSCPSRHGYYVYARDGGIFPFGSAVGYGSTGGMRLNAPVVGMATTASGHGYWVVCSDGGIFPFGDARWHSYGSTGGIRLNQPIVGMARTASGNGYWLVAADGGIFPFGDARWHSYGSTGGIRLNAPILSMTPTATGNGYWLLAADGGIFPFGDARWHSYGSTGGMRLNQPIVGMAATSSGNGYWLVARDGGIFPFGDAVWHSYGSAGGMHLSSPVVGMSRTLSGGGYWIVTSTGGVLGFGDATSQAYGNLDGWSLAAPVLGMAATP